MLRTLWPAALLLAALPAAATASDAYTTRIEPRPFYGAAVTIEAGVRVFRPLPTVRHVIVNPGGRTPLSLGYTDVRTVEHNYNYNYGEPAQVIDGAPAEGLVGGVPFFPRHFRHGHRPHHRGGGLGPSRRH